jgi:hypothetical protein
MSIDWQEDRDAAVRAIKAKRGRISILLKTKDDAYCLEEWIEHHAAIVGMSNLIIFDNNSTDERAKAILARHQPDLLVLRFDGFHNDLHVPEKIPELYAALSESFEYFLFLDADELLVVIRGHRWYNGARVGEYLAALGETPVIPAPWLYGAPRFPNLFKFGRRESDLYNDIRWGKPLLSTRLNLRGIINHNIQIDRSHYPEAFPCGLFVLHQAHVSPAQRIRSNLKKLVARRFAMPGETADEVLRRDLAGVEDRNIHLYVSEIARLRTIPEPSRDEQPRLTAGHFILRPDSKIEYFGDEEMMLMGSLLASRGSLVRRALWSAA